MSLWLRCSHQTSCRLTALWFSRIWWIWLLLMAQRHLPLSNPCLKNSKKQKILPSEYRLMVRCPLSKTNQETLINPLKLLLRSTFSKTVLSTMFRKKYRSRTTSCPSCWPVRTLCQWFRCVSKHKHPTKTFSDQFPKMVKSRPTQPQSALLEIRSQASVSLLQSLKSKSQWSSKSA